VSAVGDVLDLGRALLGYRDGMVAVLQVYLDESGTHYGSPVVTVAAYVARPGQWEAFTAEWTAAIHPIRVYHATDAANCRGEFADWTPAQVADLAKRALPIIPKHTFFAVAVGINLYDYSEAIKENPHLKSLLGEPYGACLQWTMATMLYMRSEAGGSEPIAFVHEYNDYRTEALEVYGYLTEKWGMPSEGGLMFGSKQQFAPLQAADIFAYEANKRLRDRKQPTRRALDALVPDKGRARIRYFNRENMPTLIETLERAAAANGSVAASSGADG
jgi:hypothetical protein